MKDKKTIIWLVVSMLVGMAVAILTPVGAFIQNKIKKG